MVEGPARRDWRRCKGHCQYNLLLGERLAQFFGVHATRMNPAHMNFRLRKAARSCALSSNHWPFFPLSRNRRCQ